MGRPKNNDIDPHGIWDPDRLRSARVRAGLSQDQLAEILGATRVSVGRWETGMTPRVDKRALIEQWMAKRGAGSSAESSELVAEIEQLQTLVRGASRVLIDLADALERLRQKAARLHGPL